jgi:hypothetical protein
MTVDRRSVAVGALLAEGGEGRVHEVAGRPELLYKAYRRPVPVGELQPLLDWRRQLGWEQPDLAARVQAATAWPTEVVVEPERGLATGLLLPRAPDRFSLRHRDGVRHLATLSYLTADPRQRSAAYGLQLPAPVSVGRLAIAYALARVLEAFEAGPTVLTHGDLSSKNVLWTLVGTPAVYVIDCDGSRLWDAGGRPLSERRGVHVTTPNWEDPAASGGRQPGPLSDRYSMALIFLRVVGAAHYPIQARQKRGERLVIDVEIPPWGRRAQRLPRDAKVWDLCSRGLAIAEAGDRPGAAEWREVLEATLRELSARHLVEEVQRAQGETDVRLVPLPPAVLDEDLPGDREVLVRGRPAEVRPEQWRAAVNVGRWQPPAVAGAAWRPPLTAGTPLLTTQAGRSQLRQVRQAVAAATSWWWVMHRGAALALRTRGRRGLGVRRLGLCVLTDFVSACLGLFLVAMVASPFLGL